MGRPKLNSVKRQVRFPEEMDAGLIAMAARIKATPNEAIRYAVQYFLSREPSKKGTS